MCHTVLSVISISKTKEVCIRVYATKDMQSTVSQMTSASGLRDQIVKFVCGLSLVRFIFYFSLINFLIQMDFSGSMETAALSGFSLTITFCLINVSLSV